MTKPKAKTQNQYQAPRQAAPVPVPTPLPTPLSPEKLAAIPAEPKVVEVKKAATKKIVPVDLPTYDRFTDLKFLEISFSETGAKLTTEQKTELSALEKELKACSGPVAKHTVRAAIGNEQTLMVEGVPVPAQIEKFVRDANAVDYYFEG